MVKGSLKVQVFFSMYHPLIVKWIILRKGVLGVLVLWFWLFLEWFFSFCATCDLLVQDSNRISNLSGLSSQMEMLD